MVKRLATSPHDPLAATTSPENRRSTAGEAAGRRPPSTILRATSAAQSRIMRPTCAIERHTHLGRRRAGGRHQRFCARQARSNRASCGQRAPSSGAHVRPAADAKRAAAPPSLATGRPLAVHRRMHASRNHSRGAAHSGATIRPASAQRRSTNRATVCARPLDLRRDQGARRIGHDARQARKLGHRSRDKRAASARPARVHRVRWRSRGAAACGGIGRSVNTGSDTTVGDPDPPLGEAAEEQRIKIAVDNRQSGPRPEPRLLRQAALEALTNSTRTDSPRRIGRNEFRRLEAAAAAAAQGGGGGVCREEGRRLAHLGLGL
ncbi:hypothetical protein F511_29865 [Dorcoceras hygrometricum]|uniref:Uncharacterized protein n=1 Tax=Dorcoceras hygrometricum TaxID=472368 RepID=A0A2Z7D6N3_9LAMI|nr:hypothetical protein F511_29865 [Dorcoceras hygrometricum]